MVIGPADVLGCAAQAAPEGSDTAIYDRPADWLVDAARRCEYNARDRFLGCKYGNGPYWGLMYA
jgi:hypothetical protein